MTKNYSQEKLDRICRKKEVLARVNASDSTVWRMEKAGKFPKRRTIGAGMCGWLLSEIDEWFDNLKKEADQENTVDSPR